MILYEGNEGVENNENYEEDILSYTDDTQTVTTIIEYVPLSLSEEDKMLLIEQHENITTMYQNLYTGLSLTNVFLVIVILTTAYRAMLKRGS